MPLTILYNACITEVQAFKDFAENKGVLELLAFSASNKKLARDNDGNILDEELCSLQKLPTHNATILGRAMDIHFACVYGRIQQGFIVISRLWKSALFSMQFFSIFQSFTGYEI